MRYVRLVAVCDEYDTEPGLVVKGTVLSEGMMADHGSGDMIAHDLIEHQNGIKEIGPVWDELEALGGIWQVRGRWGDMMQDRPSIWTPAQSVASRCSDVCRVGWLRRSERPSRGQPRTHI